MKINEFFVRSFYRQNYRQKNLHIRILWACRVSPQVTYKQRVIGSNPITPTNSGLRTQHTQYVVFFFIKILLCVSFCEEIIVRIIVKIGV